MPGGVAKRVHTAHLLSAWILTSSGGLLAVFIVGTVIVTSTFYHND